MKNPNTFFFSEKSPLYNNKVDADSKLRLYELVICVTALVAETQNLNTVQSWSQYRGHLVHCIKPVSLLDLQVDEY